MKNAIATQDDLMSVLSNSLYVGAQPESIKMVLSYCQAAGLDPMLKPVHIVPMYCATGKKDGRGQDIKAMRDVIMPGIGLYRTQAANSKQYAGASEPLFGEDITEEIEGIKITYPKWCKVTVNRQIDSGVIAEFSAIEFWKENYATKSRDSKLPNAMWGKRPYGQIAKCAEAQALRKGFPEFGSQPTAEEMEGKEIDITPDDAKKIEYISDIQKQTLDDRCLELSVDKPAFCAFLGVSSLDTIPENAYQAAMHLLEEKEAKLKRLAELNESAGK